MLSKVLRDDRKDTAQPLPWKRAGGKSVPTVTAVTKGLLTANGADAISAFAHGADEEGALQNQITALQRKVAEVEAAHERRLKEVREAALREGEAAGRSQAVAQVQPVVDKLAQSIRQIAEMRPKLRHEAETDVVKLALAIAKRILHRELSADPDSVSALIRVAMEKIRSHEIVRVRIHPQHHAAVQAVVAQITMGAQVETLADAKLPLGGVVVETTRGEFDASVETQLREIERGLTDRLAHAGR
jgi:flagellar assembly protein FliH